MSHLVTSFFDVILTQAHDVDGAGGGATRGG